MTVERGRAVGASRRRLPADGVVVRSDARRALRSSPRLRSRGSRRSRRSASSPGTCAARSAAPATSADCTPTTRSRCPIDVAEVELDGASARLRRARRRPPIVVARARVGRDERRVDRATGTSRRARTRATGCSTSSTSRSSIRDDRVKARRRLAHRHARASSATITQVRAASATRRVSSTPPVRRAGSTVRRVGDATVDRACASTGELRRRRRLGSGAMYAWILDESPGSYRWGEMPDPEPGPDDVVVSVVASALNHMDLWLTRGMPKPPLASHPRLRRRRRSCTPSASAVTNVAIGDEVVVNPGVSPVDEIIALGNDSPMGSGFGIWGEHDRGGHANFAIAPARNIVKRPPNRTWEECAAYPLCYLTAWRMLRRARLGAGDTLLVVGHRRRRRHRRARAGQGDGRARLVTSRDRDRSATARSSSVPTRAFDSADVEVADHGRRRRRERGPGDVGPIGAGAEVRRPARAVRRHVGHVGRAEPAPALLQADRDHRLDDGLVPGVRRGHRARRERPAGRRRRDLPAHRLPDGARSPRRGQPSSERSSSSTDVARPTPRFRRSEWVSVHRAGIAAGP